MRIVLIEDSIDCYKSVVYLSIYRGGGWTLYTTEFRANSANLANKHSTKLGTLIYSAHARTVRPTGADCPAFGLDRPLAHFGAKHPLIVYIFCYFKNSIYVMKQNLY
jgi:hypothetical protein